MTGVQTCALPIYCFLNQQWFTETDKNQKILLRVWVESSVTEMHVRGRGEEDYLLRGRSSSIRVISEQCIAEGRKL